jgi:hypothetical protein
MQRPWLHVFTQGSGLLPSVSFHINYLKINDNTTCQFLNVTLTMTPQPGDAAWMARSLLAVSRGERNRYSSEPGSPAGGGGEGCAFSKK